MIKTKIIKLKSTENEEIIMAMAMTKTIITTAIVKIIIIIIFIIAVVIIIFAIAIAIIISSFSMLLSVIILVFIILFYLCIYGIFLNFKRINIYIYKTQNKISKSKVFCFQANVIISCGQSTLAALTYKSDWGNKTNKIKRKLKLKLTRTKLITAIE